MTPPAQETLQQISALLLEGEQIEALCISLLAASKAHGIQAREAVAPLQSYYQTRLEAIVDARQRAELATDALDATERRLLRLRYLDGMNWEEISDTLCYSLRQTHRLHARALDNLHFQ